MLGSVRGWSAMAISTAINRSIFEVPISYRCREGNMVPWLTACMGRTSRPRGAAVRRPRPGHCVAARTDRSPCAERRRGVMRGSLLERAVRHTKDCPKCGRGEGHQVIGLMVTYPGGRTRQFSVRRGAGCRSAPLARQLSGTEEDDRGRLANRHPKEPLPRPSWSSSTSGTGVMRCRNARCGPIWYTRTLPASGY
jgi:hypothetical protein